MIILSQRLEWLRNIWGQAFLWRLALPAGSLQEHLAHSYASPNLFFMTRSCRGLSFLTSFCNKLISSLNIFRNKYSTNNPKPCSNHEKPPEPNGLDTAQHLGSPTHALPPQYYLRGVLRNPRAKERTQDLQTA